MRGATIQHFCNLDTICNMNLGVIIIFKILWWGGLTNTFIKVTWNVFDFVCAMKHKHDSFGNWDAHDKKTT